MMKSKFKWITYGLFLTGSILFVACQHKSEESKEVEHEVEITLDSTQVAQKEWETYSAKVLDKIAENELKISEIQDKLKGKGVLDKVRQNKIDELKKRNQDLRNKLNTWTSDYTKWDKFKMEVEKEIDDLGKAIRDMYPE